MLSILLHLIILVLALQPALAAVYVTNPVASTQAFGGQVLNVEWEDDGNSPTLAEIGQCSVDLYTGSATQQTQLQNLAASVNVSMTSRISATIDPDVGPAGAMYFIRFTALSLKSTSDPDYPYEAFSAKFNLTSMTGQFNATVLAQLSSSGSSSSAIVSSSSQSSSASSTRISTSTSASMSASASSTANKESGALRLAVPGVLAGLVGVTTYLVL